MQTSEKNRVVKTNRRRVQASTTLSRKYIKRPAEPIEPVETSPMVQHFNSPMPETMPTEQVAEAVQQHPMQSMVNTRMQERQGQSMQTEQKMSARELKDQAIQKALASASNTSSDSKKSLTRTKKNRAKKSSQIHFGFGRVMLALGCAAAAVFAIVYFVNLNMPDISMRVAAMQTGINPAYPNYVPRDYSVSSITSEEGKIALVFDNSNTGGSFTLTEESSSWDSNALLSNFVKSEYGDSYTIIREQGLTLYVSGSDAAWVNGGVVYKIDTTAGALTNKQIRSIAVSL